MGQGWAWVLVSVSTLSITGKILDHWELPSTYSWPPCGTVLNAHYCGDFHFVDHDTKLCHNCLPLINCCEEFYMGHHLVVLLDVF